MEAVQVNRKTLSQAIKEKAGSLGASLVGIAGCRCVLKTPSHQDNGGIQRRFKSGAFIVLALEHPASTPLLDWWTGRGGTSGNRELHRISRSLQNWLKNDFEIASRILSYHVGKGGIFLKEAAVMAGLGVIGQNNLLITPQYGAGVRLRALFLEREDVRPDKPLGFAPCHGCLAPCRRACPQNALTGGRFQRSRCSLQMLRDEADQIATGMAGIRYCRACEWACPVSQGVFKSGT